MRSPPATQFRETLPLAGDLTLTAPLNPNMPLTPSRGLGPILVFFGLAALHVVDAQQGDASSTNPDALKSLSLEQLSQIEVTSPSKEPTPAFRSPVAIYVITGDDIRRSGATTLADALRLAPGVEVAQIDAGKWSVGIRGFGTQLSRDVLVMIDGRSVYTPLFAGTYWQVQDTLLEDVDRIEVIRGPGGTIWGPNAVNGVINIITKSSKDTQGVFASAGGGSQQQGFYNFRYGGDAGNDFTYRFYAKGFTRGPDEHTDHDNFDDWRGDQGGFRLDWSRGQNTYTLQGDGYAEEAGERVSYGTYVPPVNGTLEGDAHYSGANVVFRWTRAFQNGDNFQLQAYYDRTNHQELNFGQDLDAFDVDLLQRTKIGSRQQLLYGLGARVYNGHFDELYSDLVFSPFHRIDYLYTGFLEDDITLAPDKLTLTVGSKILRTNYTGFHAEPSARLLWTPTTKDSVWTAYTHALRTPSDGEEDFYLSSFQGTSNGLPVYARFNANSQFAPEQLNGYELGYRRLITQSLFVDVASFYNHYHDLFSEDLTGPLSIQTSLPFPAPAAPAIYALEPLAFRNSLYGYTKGFEIAPEWRPTSFWRLRGSYSFLHMNLAKKPGTFELGTAPLTVGASPQHEVVAGSSFDISKRFQLDLTYRFVSSLPSITQKVPAYSTGDARFAWQLCRAMQFSVTGQNLFQPHHLEYTNDPNTQVGIVRSVFASLSFAAK